MEDDSLSQGAKKSRRPRLSGGDRVFSCGCGKSYLSYPALYTHVKNKHSGIFPIGSNARRKAPSPSVVPSELFQQNIDKFRQEFMMISSTIQGSSPDAPFPIDESLFAIQGEELEKEAHKLRDLILAEGDSSQPLNTSTAQPLAPGSPSIYTVIAKFAEFITPYCNRSFFSEYILFLIFLCHALNRKGSSFVPKEAVTGDFCDSKFVSIAAEILNMFIAENFPVALKAFQKGNPQTQLTFLGFEEEHIRNLIVMAKFLANWLFHMGYIDYRLEINVDG